MGGIDEILENAQRLRSDAQFLFDDSRYASCGLLQVICLEELGKAYIVKENVPKSKRKYHLQKQEVAIALAGATHLNRLMQATCTARGWEYWESDADADRYYAWLLTDEGLAAFNTAMKKTNAWLHNVRDGLLEKARLVASYIDDGPEGTGTKIEDGKNYTYKVFDAAFCKSAFSFIEAAFEGLSDEKTILWVETLLADSI